MVRRHAVDPGETDEPAFLGLRICTNFSSCGNCRHRHDDWNVSKQGKAKPIFGTAGYMALVVRGLDMHHFSILIQRRW